MRWRYRVERINRDVLEDSLNELGRSGWEVASVDPDYGVRPFLGSYGSNQVCVILKQSERET